MAHLDGVLAWNGGRRDESGGAGEALSAGSDDAAAASRRADLGEMLGGREDLAFGGADVLFAARHDEDGLLTAHRCLDVRVGLGPQCLDLATWNFQRGSLITQ